MNIVRKKLSVLGLFILGLVVILGGIIIGAIMDVEIFSKEKIRFEPQDAKIAAPIVLKIEQEEIQVPKDMLDQTFLSKIEKYAQDSTLVTVSASCQLTPAVTRISGTAKQLVFSNIDSIIHRLEMVEIVMHMPVGARKVLPLRELQWSVGPHIILCDSRYSGIILVY